MMTKPVLTTFTQMAEIMIQTYERYLPNAFDENLTLLQKVNKVIEYLNQIGKVTNDVVAQWNSVMDWVMNEGLASEIDTRLDVMIADGTLNDVINHSIFDTLNTAITAVQTIQSNNIKYVSVEKYNNDLNLALASEQSIRLPEGTFNVTPLTRNLLNGKNIKGSGKNTILKFTGQVTAFDLDGVQNTFLSDFTIVVDSANTQDVMLLRGFTDESLRNKIENICFDTVDKTQGLYTAIRVLSNIKGVYQNAISNIVIENCKNGILLEARLGTAWATHNLINNPYIRKYTGIALGFIEDAGANVINNIVSNPRILDFTMENITRTALKMDGRFNAVTNIQMFNDGTAGTCVALEIKDIHVCYNNTLTGAMEGTIVNEHMISANNVSLNVVKRKNVNSMIAGSKPISLLRSNLSNLLFNSDFRNGQGLWYGVNATLQSLAGSINSKALKVTTTVSGGKMQIDVPKPSQYNGKTFTFTALVKTTVPLRIVMSEGGTSFDFGSSINNDGKPEVISVSRKITSNELHLMIAVEDYIAIGANFTVEWVCLSEGVEVPLHNVPEKINYIRNSKGRGTVAATTSNLVVTHGLDITPNPEDISITPLSWWDTGTGELQWWVTEVGATTFKLQLSKNAPAGGWSFGWRADV